MFFRQIDDFETFFKWLDRLNILAYNVWRDRQADAYKTGVMHQIETLYRTYISDMRQISNELALLQKQIEEEKQEIYRLEKEIAELKREGIINHCYEALASGFYDDNGEQKGEERFAVAFEEDPFEVAFERCQDLEIIEDAHIINGL